MNYGEAAGKTGMTVVVDLVLVAGGENENESGAGSQVSWLVSRRESEISIHPRHAMP